MAYRQARCIELHAAGVAIAQHEDGYSFTVLPGRGEYATRPVYKIPFFDLAKVCETLGIVSTYPSQYISLKGAVGSTHQTMAEDRGKGENLETVVQSNDFEVNIFRHYEEINDTTDFRLETLEAEILSANLINIRIGLKWDGNENIDLSEMTYSGAFTVWWGSGE